MFGIFAHNGENHDKIISDVTLSIFTGNTVIRFCIKKNKATVNIIAEPNRTSSHCKKKNKQVKTTKIWKSNEFFFFWEEM